MMTILISSSWTTFLDRAPLGEDLWIAPPYATMGETLLSTSSLGLFLQIGCQALSIWSYRDACLELALDDDHHLTSSSTGYMRSPFWCKPMGRYLTQHRDSTHIYHGLVHKAIWTIVTVPRDHIIPIGISFSFVCWSILNPSLYFILINLVSFLLSPQWWCLEDKYECPHNLLLQDILAICSILLWHIFG